MLKSTKVTRRRFLALASSGAMILGAPALRKEARAQDSPARTTAPDVIVVNANIYTVDPKLPRAEAFAIRGGRLQGVGSNADVRNLAHRDTPVFDAQKMTIVPGLIDCHNHAEGESLLFKVLVGDPFEVKFVTIDDIVEKLKKRADETPPGTWVEGQFFDDTKVRDGRILNIHDLDKVSAQHPVAVHHRGGHTAFYNSKALQLAGITKNSPNPPGGTFDRDKSGELMSTGAYFNVPAVTVVLVCTALLLAGTQLSARLNNVLVIANVAAITSLELRG
jgi:predicted amidohydrolase YtcJ